jgi:hypothetical protein
MISGKILRDAIISGANNINNRNMNLTRNVSGMFYIGGRPSKLGYNLVVLKA